MSEAASRCRLKAMRCRLKAMASHVYMVVAVSQCGEDGRGHGLAVATMMPTDLGIGVPWEIGAQVSPRRPGLVVH